MTREEAHEIASLLDGARAVRGGDAGWGVHRAWDDGSWGWLAWTVDQARRYALEEQQETTLAPG